MVHAGADVLASHTVLDECSFGSPLLSGTPGPWLVHYTYDGLGRLIR